MVGCIHVRVRDPTDPYRGIHPCRIVLHLRSVALTSEELVLDQLTPQELFKKANEIARKKFTRAGLLKIMEANSKRCPVCGSPVFYAPRAPEDSSKYACSDIDCVNAHGIVDFGMEKEEE